MNSISLELPNGRTVDSFTFADWIVARYVHCVRRVFGFSACIRWSSIAAFGYLLIVGMVAAYDILLTVRYANFLVQMESNPIGRWIMNLKMTAIQDLEISPNITPFLILKVIGTLVVMGVIIGLIHWRSHMGHLVGLGVSGFQLGLAAYLTYF